MLAAAGTETVAALAGEETGAAAILGSVSYPHYLSMLGMFLAAPAIATYNGAMGIYNDCF
jgi:hypothetical protein